MSNLITLRKIMALFLVVKIAPIGQELLFIELHKLCAFDTPKQPLRRSKEVHDAAEDTEEEWRSVLWVPEPRAKKNS